jgi:hypothetical protein
MDMGAAGFVKKPGIKDLVPGDFAPANRTDSGSIPFKTINTAHDMHHPVLSPQARKSRGFYPFSRGQPGGTNRAGLGEARGRPEVFFRKSPVSFLPAPGDTQAAFTSDSEKKAIAKPKKEGAYNHHNKYLYPFIHISHISHPNPVALSFTIGHLRQFQNLVDSNSNSEIKKLPKRNVSNRGWLQDIVPL